MDIAEGFIDFLSLFETELVSPGLKDLFHSSFGVAVKPNDSALRIESRIGRTNFIKFLIAMIETNSHNYVTLDTFDKRLIKIFAKIFRTKCFCVLSDAFYLIRIKKT